MSIVERFIDLHDGVRLAYVEQGDPAGVPVRISPRGCASRLAGWSSAASPARFAADLANFVAADLSSGGSA